jgi:hypothetical protein
VRVTLPEAVATLEHTLTLRDGARRPARVTLREIVATLEHTLMCSRGARRRE